MNLDRFSDLPEFILHDMLSCMSYKDATTCSTLSDRWRMVYTTFPVLHFSDSYVYNEDFLERVNRTLDRYVNGNLRIKGFHLFVKHCSIAEITGPLNIWLGEVGRKKVESLELDLPHVIQRDLPHDIQGDFYVLPEVIIERNLFRRLILKGGIQIDQACYNRHFCLLKALTLDGVITKDEHMLNHVISSCPSIEDLHVRDIHVLNQYGRIQKLESLTINGPSTLKLLEAKQIQNVIIHAPVLNFMSYCPNNINSPFEIRFDNGLRLTELELASIKITRDDWLSELFSVLPSLQRLKFKECLLPRWLVLSNNHLKELKFVKCLGCSELKIYAQSLLSFGYAGDLGDPATHITFLNNSNKLELDLHLITEYSDLSRLKGFLENIHSETTVNISICLAISVPHEDQVTFHVSLSPKVKHLELQATFKHELVIPNVVNIILSCCEPTTISFPLHTKICSRKFIEVFHDKLMKRMELECFCIYNEQKCWWHKIKNLKVTSSMELNKNIDFKSMLKALPSYAPGETIEFEFEF